VLVGLSLGALLVATTQAVTRRSLLRASEDLETARAAFDRSLDSRTQSAAALTRLVTELPIFRAHLTDARLAADPATITEMADGYRRQLNAAFAVVTDARGRWAGSPGWPAGTAPAPGLQAAIESAVSGTSHREIVAVNDNLFLVVSEPARFAEEVLGTMTVGYALDDAVARELARATHCDVNLVAGTHKPSSGRIRFNGQDVTGLRPDHVAKLGIARTFQTTHLFDNATVLDNLIVGHRLRTRSGLWDVLANTRRLQEEERLCREKAREALDFVGL